MAEAGKQQQTQQTFQLLSPLASSWSHTIAQQTRQNVECHQGRTSQYLFLETHTAITVFKTSPSTEFP
jgi:hypothetical protein